MTHPLAGHVESMAQWIAHLSRQPGWAEYARDKLRNMATNTMYIELPKLVRKELEAADAPQ